jgi:hypothetical protein
MSMMLPVLSFLSSISVFPEFLNIEVVGCFDSIYALCPPIVGPFSYSFLFLNRSHKEKRSSYAPESGVRYDGVYRIEKCWRKIGIQVT